MSCIHPSDVCSHVHVESTLHNNMVKEMRIARKMIRDRCRKTSRPSVIRLSKVVLISQHGSRQVETFVRNDFRALSLLPSDACSRSQVESLRSCPNRSENLAGRSPSTQSVSDSQGHREALSLRLISIAVL
jgi:hypothetical protein